MNVELDDALDCANEVHQNRLKKQRQRRRRTYFNEADNQLACEELNSSQMCTFQSIGEVESENNRMENKMNIVDEEIILSDYDSGEGVRFVWEIDQNNEENDMDEIIDCHSPRESNEVDDINSIVEAQTLHEHTNISVDLFCNRLVQLFRRAKLSKTDHQKFLDLFHSGLPVPNSLPLNMKNLLKRVRIGDNLFKKRKVCCICHRDLNENVDSCSNCPNSNHTKIACIYESDLMKILMVLLKQYWPSINDNIIRIRTSNDAIKTYDLISGKLYQSLLKKFPTEKFISGLLHLDGIALCNSSKLKLWLCSMSIVELPARIRYQRYNMPVISIWVGYQEPVASFWLQNTIFVFDRLKVSGKQPILSLLALRAFFE